MCCGHCCLGWELGCFPAAVITTGLCMPACPSHLGALGSRQLLPDTPPWERAEAGGQPLALNFWLQLGHLVGHCRCQLSLTAALLAPNLLLQMAGGGCTHGAPPELGLPVSPPLKRWHFPGPRSPEGLRQCLVWGYRTCLLLHSPSPRLPILLRLEGGRPSAQVCVCILGRGTSLLLRGTSKVTKCSEPPATHPSQDPGIREGQEVPTA